MSWIRFAVAGIALCAGASVASAQGGPPMGGQQGQRQGGGRGMQAMLFEGITLSDAQQTKIEEIRAKYRPQMAALRPADGAQAGPPDKATRDKMEDIQENQTKEIRAILSDDQQKIFDVNVTAMKKRREEMMKQREGKN
ncbi:MAG: Spy/CpxP family protein refolding chaperone [Thermoanaerobaculia bacterium]